MRMHRLSVLFALVVMTGCGASPDAGDVAALATAAPAVLAENRGAVDVPASRWPAAIARLHPERVYATDDGLYVVTSSRFVDERGLFVPRDAAFAPQPGTDPSYVATGRGVFSYWIKG